MFATDNESDRDTWVNSLKASAGRHNESTLDDNGEVVDNPVLEENGASGNWMKTVT